MAPPFPAWFDSKDESIILRLECAVLKTAPPALAEFSMKNRIDYG